MAHKHRKTRKYRGSRTCGWGRQGQHRGSGRKGGRGRGGLHDHKWVPPAPKYEGKHGFRPRRTVKEVKAINIDELNNLVDRLLQEGKLEKRDGKIMVDLSELGYDKLLGSGYPVKPLLIRVSAFSRKAAEKIKMKGGEVITAR